MKAAKEEWTEEQCQNIEKEMMSGNSKEVKALTKTYQRRSAVIGDISVNILTESCSKPMG